MSVKPFRSSQDLQLINRQLTTYLTTRDVQFGYFSLYFTNTSPGQTTAVGLVCAASLCGIIIPLDLQHNLFVETLSGKLSLALV